MNVSDSHAWVFLSTSGFLCFLQRIADEWRNSNGMRESVGNVLVVIFSLLILVEKSVVKLQPLEPAIQGGYEK